METKTAQLPRDRRASAAVVTAFIIVAGAALSFIGEPEVALAGHSPGMPEGVYCTNHYGPCLKKCNTIGKSCFLVMHNYPDGSWQTIWEPLGCADASNQCSRSCPGDTCHITKRPSVGITANKEPKPALKEAKRAVQPVTATSTLKPGPKQTKVSPQQPVTAQGGPAFCDPSGKCTPAPSVAPPKPPPSQSASSSCGSLSTGPGATAIGEESCNQPSVPKIGSPPPPGSKGPTTTISGKAVPCFNYNSAQQVVPSDCSTQGAFYLPSPNDAEPQPETVSEPSDIAQQPSSPASSPHSSPVQVKNVSQRNECPELDRNKRPCIQGMPGSEQKGDWTIYKVDITNSCECTCAVDGTDSRGQGRGVIVEAYSKDKITCIRTPQGGCTGFKDDLSYNCHR
jgi:hypothetical protein